MMDIREYMQQTGQRARGAARLMARASTGARNQALEATARARQSIVAEISGLIDASRRETIAVIDARVKEIPAKEDFRKVVLALVQLHDRLEKLKTRKMDENETEELGKNEANANPF